MKNRFACTVIKNLEGKYRCKLEIEGVEIQNIEENVDYKTLKKSIEDRTGIIILKYKDMIFERLSNTEKIATIDATQYREGKDCRVTISDRIEGWKPNFN